MNITGTTRVLGIIGSPVGHSLSPAMQNAAIEEMGLDYVYVPFPVEPDYLGPAVEGLRRLGVWGFNVTIPHKTAIIPFLDRVSPDAELCGAVNTVCRDGDLLIGHNTDTTGFLDSLVRDLAFDPRGAAVMLLGAGGAAQAAIAALSTAGVSRIIIANRTLHKARSLAERFAALFPRVEYFLSSLEEDDMKRNAAATGLLVNTTSVGMNGTNFECIPFPENSPGFLVYDMVYTPAETPLLAAARRMGLKCANGAGMLVSQGEAAFRLWIGKKPPTGVMKNALFRKLEQQQNLDIRGLSK